MKYLFLHETDIQPSCRHRKKILMKNVTKMPNQLPRIRITNNSSSASN